MFHSYPLEIYVLKTSIFALEALLLGKILILFNENEISAGQLSADSSSTETLYCLIRAHKKAVSYIFFA